MKDRPASGGPQNPSEKTQVTPGMAALLRGGNGEPREPNPASESPNTDPASIAAATRKKQLIRLSMFVADGLLIALVARLAFVSHGHFGFFEIALCILAFGIGAWLSCLALWMK